MGAHARPGPRLCPPPELQPMRTHSRGHLLLSLTPTAHLASGRESVDACLLPACARGEAPPRVLPSYVCPLRPRPVARIRGGAARARCRAPGRYISARAPPRPPLSIHWHLTPTHPTRQMSDDQHGGGGGQRQCRRRGITVDFELGAALALADMAGLGLGSAAMQAQPQPRPPVQLHTAGAGRMAKHEEEEEDEEMVASTRLSLELGKVAIPSSSGSSSSSAGRAATAAAAVPAHSPSKPRHMLTEAEKEAKRLRRVLANRESARQTILRRQAIRDELARKVADLSSQNENMKKEKDMVMKEYLSLKETNRQLKAQAQHLSLSLF
ncbi:hypothetical protein ACP70R_020468 [Stipagrostis hirtigluma subsp. patula]